MHRGKGKKERSIAFVHWSQDEFMTLGEQKMEGTNLVILILNSLSENTLVEPIFIFKYSVNIYSTMHP